jgi:acetylornithine deacetylase
MGLTAKTVQRVRKAVDASRNEIVTTCLEWGNLHDLAGDELPVAEAVADGYRLTGLDTRLLFLSETSANVIGRRRADTGAGDGPTLILNSHLDTEGSTPRGSGLERLHLRGTWQDGDILIGKGLVNAKVHLVAQMFALRAIYSAEVGLEGDIVLTAAAQETGGDSNAPSDPAWTGPHEREGVGTIRMLEHGLTGDYALVGEPTGFAISAAQAGYVRVRLSLPGFVPYTPFIERGSDAHDNPNPIERAGPVLVALRDWATRYERSHRIAFRNSEIIPKAQVHEIRASGPLFTEHSDACIIFFDVRTPPGTTAPEIVEAIRGAITDVEPDVDVATYDQRPGFVAENAEHLIDAVRLAHESVFGEPPPPPQPSQISMWQDSNSFNQAGIPSISYGIRPIAETWTRERFRAARIEDVLKLTACYALTMLEICNT